MVNTSSLSVPLTLKVTVKFEAVTETEAEVMLRVPVKLAVPTPGLNCQPVGMVRISVWLLPAAKSVAAPSVMTMLPRAVNAAPLVELSALSAETLFPPVGEVMTTAARSCGECNAINPKTRPRRNVNRVDCIPRSFPVRKGFNCMKWAREAMDNHSLRQRSTRVGSATGLLLLPGCSVVAAQGRETD